MADDDDNDKKPSREVTGKTVLGWDVMKKEFGRKAVYRALPVGIFGFAAGWAITQAITNQFIPNDPAKGAWDMAGGLACGIAVGLLVGAGVVSFTPLRVKY